MYFFHGNALPTSLLAFPLPRALRRGKTPCRRMRACAAAPSPASKRSPRVG